MFIPDPDFFPSRIPDPKTATKERGDNKFVVIPFFCSHKFHKIEHYFIFEMLMIKIGANFQRIIDFFTRKIVVEISKICVWDPGSEIQKEKTYSGSRIPDSGVKNTPDPGSGSETLIKYSLNSH